MTPELRLTRAFSTDPLPFGLSLSKPSLSVLLGALGFWTYLLHCADRSF